jgi:hypothetical protein
VTFVPFFKAPPPQLRRLNQQPLSSATGNEGNENIEHIEIDSNSMAANESNMSNVPNEEDIVVLDATTAAGADFSVSNEPIEFVVSSKSSDKVNFAQNCSLAERIDGRDVVILHAAALQSTSAGPHTPVERIDDPNVVAALQSTSAGPHTPVERIDDPNVVAVLQSTSAGPHTPVEQIDDPNVVAALQSTSAGPHTPWS